MSLGLGAVVGRVVLDDAAFQAKWRRITGQLGGMGKTAGDASAGVDKLDASLTETGASADKAAAGLKRAGAAAEKSAAATERDAAAAQANTDARARLAEISARTASLSQRAQAAALREAAATERVAEVNADATASFRSLASAQASAISASRGVVAAQEAEKRAALGSAAAWKRSGAAMTTAGATINRKVTTPVLAAVGASAFLAAKFNSTMTRIQTQAGASSGDVRVLSKDVLALGKYAEQGPDQLASSLYHLKSVGMSNVSAMRALRQSSDLAAVSGSNMEDTTNALAGAWRTGIRGAMNFHDAVKTLNAVVGAGNMSMTDLTAALGTGILPTAKTFGLTLKDVGSALALFTDEGVPAEAAATRLRMSISLLGAPSAAAEKQLAKIGLTGTKLGNDMRRPNGLIVAIGDLKAHLDDSGLSATRQAQLLSHAFGGGRSSSAILSMVNNYDVLNKKQAQVTTGIGKYDKAVAAQRATPTAKFKELSAELETVSIKLGDDVLPALVKITGVVDDGVKAFEGFSHTDKEMIGWGLGVVAALGPVLAIGGRLMKLYGLVRLAAVKVGIGASTSAGTVAEAESAQTRAVIASVDAQTAALRGLIAAQQAAADSAVAASATTARAYGRQAAAAGTAAAETAAADTTITEANAGAAASSRGAGGLPIIAAAGRGGRAPSRFAGAATPITLGMLSALLGYKGGRDSSQGLPTGQRRRLTALGFLSGAPAYAANKITKSFIAPHLGLTVAGHGSAKASDEALAKFIYSGRTATRVELAFAKAIEADGPRYKGNQQAVAAMAASQLGLSKSARQAGLTQTDLKNAVTGSGTAYNRVVAAWKAGAHPSAEQLAGLARLRAAFKAGGQQAQAYAYSHNLLNNAEGKTARLSDVLRGKVENYNAANLSASQAAGRFQGQLGALTKSVAQNGATLNTNSLFGQRNIAAMKNAAGAALAHAQAVYTQTGSLKKADNALLSDRAQLIRTGEAAGLSATQATRLANSILGIPSHKVSKVTVDLGSAPAQLAALRNSIFSLVNGRHVVTVQYVQTGQQPGDQTGHGAGVIHLSGQRRAAGGEIHGRGTETSDDVPFMGSDGEFVVNAKQYRRHRALVRAINAGTLPGYARGGEIARTQAWMRGPFNHGRYVYGAAGPHSWDCSGGASDAIEHLLGMRQHRRLFSTNNEGAVLPGLGFRHGAGRNAAMVIGWQNSGGTHHTAFSVGGLKGEARDTAEGIIVGSRAKDPRSFPNVMNLPDTRDKYGKPGGDPPSSGNGGNIAAIVRNLRSQGITSAGSIGGVLGNFQVESGLRSTAYNPRENAHGLAQWEGGRWKQLQAFARRHHESPTSTRAQLGYFDYELHHGYRNVLRYLQGHHSAAATAAYFDKFFEGSSGSTRKERERDARRMARYGAMSDSQLARLGGSDGGSGESKSDRAFKRRLDALRARVAAVTKLRTQERVAFASAVRGTFDITTAGQDDNGRVTAGSLMAAQTQDIAKARLWLTDMTKLDRLRIFPDTYLRALAAKGPDALPTVRALLAMPKGELARFARGEQTLSKLGTQVGLAVSSRLDNPAISAAKHAERVYERQHRRDAARDDAQLARAIATEISKVPLTGQVHVDHGDLVIAVRTGEGRTRSRIPTHRPRG